MNSGNTIKTTVRLPTELHWEFQGERAKRRLSNEKAVSEAFALWIADPPRTSLYKTSPSRTSTPAAHERKHVEMLLRILRDRGNPVGASALTAVLDALSGQFRDEVAKRAHTLISVRPENKAVRRSVKRARAS